MLISNIFLIQTSYLRKKKDFVVGLFVISPVFISWSLSGDFGFDRVGGTSSDYFISLPLSLLIGMAFIARYVAHLLRSRDVVFLALWIIFGGVMKYAYNFGVDYSYIKITAEMLLFIMLTKSFEYYWVSQAHQTNSELDVIIRPFVIIVALISISSIYLDAGSIIVNSIKIYNFEQYYAFSIIPFLMILFSKNTSKILLVFIVSFSIYIAKVSVNMTALIVIVFCLLYYVAHLITPVKANKSLYSATVLFLLVFTVFIYPVLLLFLDSNGLISSRGLYIRAGIMRGYFQSLEYYNLIFPFLSDIRPVRAGMHNQLLEVFYTTGIVGLVYYYYFILKRLLKFNYEFRLVGISIAAIIFIGGATVSPTLHPYLILIIAYVTSYYYSLSIMKRTKEIKS